MLCPVCQIELVHEGTVLACPSRHGILVTGKVLQERETISVDDKGDSQAVNTKQQLTCPNCSAAMQKVNYNDTEIIIDSCPNCMYRWLDTGELAKIRNYKPNPNAENLLFLLDFDDKLKSVSNDQIENPNPDVPLTSGVVGGLVKGGMAGDDKRTLSFMLTAGISGLIIGMIKSKFMRIVGPIFIIGLGILFYMILNASFAIKP